MGRIRYLDYPNESKEIKEAYDNQLKASGYVTNMKKTLLRSLPSYTALMQWYPLRDEVQKFIGARGVVIFCHAISTQNECLICSMYFKKEFDDLGIDLKTLEFSEVEQLLEIYGRRLVSHPNDIDDQLFSKLREHFDETQLVALTAFGAMMIATNLINNALKVDLDDHLTSYVNKDNQ